MSVARRLALLGLFVVAIVLGLMEGSRPAGKAHLDPLSIRVTLMSGGSLRLEAREGVDHALGMLALEDSAASAIALAHLREDLGRLAQEGARRSPDSPDSRAVLELTVDSAAPWGEVQWLLQVAAFPARIHHIRFALVDDSAAPVANELPLDGSIGLVPEVERFVRVTLWRTAEASGRTRARLTLIDYKPHYGHIDTGESRACEPGYEGIRAGLAGFGADLVGRAGELETPLPSGAKLPYRDVVDALRALRDVHSEPVQLLGAPVPLPKAPSR